MVLITLDTTRADALGGYGGPAEASPVLDGLAAEGVRFDWALSHVPTTLSAHTSIFTGLDPHGHRVPRNGYAVSPELPTVAETLSAAGWDTLGVIAATAVDPETGVTRGFRKIDADLDVDKGKRHEAPGDDVTARALKLVDRRQAGQPLFLWVHYYDAHSPYEAPEGWADPFLSSDHVPSWGEDPLEYMAREVRMGTDSARDRATLRGLYQGEVRFQDDQVGQLLEGLRERGVMEDATVVIVADHGEMFFEERLRPVGHGADIDLWLTHVPLIIWGRGAGVVEQPVALSDLGPTLLALAGLPGELGTGRDLTPLLTGGSIEPTPIFLEATRPGAKEGPGWNNRNAEQGVVYRDHLLTRGNWTGGITHLYAMDDDQSPVEDEAVKRELNAHLGQFQSTMPEFRDDPIEGGMREALRALGYLE